MSLEQAIHQRWAADSALPAALPAENVVTGRHAGRQVPYATVHRRDNRSLLRTNAGGVDEATVAIHVWHDDHDAGRAILDLVEGAFDRAEFALPGGQGVARARRTLDTAEEHDGGLWRFSIEFVVRVHFSWGA